ncbi:hypothetical protein JOY44_18915 [Phormidium sp. CLA17]|uniref:hypothetical protein n=1 Tax=Leptolyngbya sp. Cla-17 TaxID=2803751 RepID=UPI0014925434|nr:hypothetical protein [Leptolyngbya sp. Cla-17]MBM0743662.1 hypothetical protein [Leptolyngbya sp. Cla-17]
MTLPNFNSLVCNTPQPAPLLGSRWISLGLLITLVSCGGQAASESSGTISTSGIVSPKTTSIQEVQKTADRNSVVTVKGVVGDRVPILDGTVYEVQDATGKIWILTKKQPPAPGQEAVITGNIRFKSIPLNGQEQGSVYVEQE